MHWKKFKSQCWELRIIELLRKECNPQTYLEISKVKNMMKNLSLLEKNNSIFLRRQIIVS